MDIISAVSSFFTEILTVASNFMEEPENTLELEKRLQQVSHKTCAQLMREILEDYDSFLIDTPQRKKDYTIQRHDPRTLITMFGDVTFNRTLVKSRSDGHCRYLLDEKIHLPKDEHFSELAEVTLLQEATQSSYQRAADRLKVEGQTVSKVAVMNKVHGILEELPLPQSDSPRQCQYLYIEADEDHIHRQKTDPSDKDGCIIGKLVYLYEGKEELCKNRRRLVAPVFLGGRYAGSDGNRRLWERVQEYIEKNYDAETLKKVYICGDGGGWIKAGKDYIHKSVLVADKFHLMKYINSASNQMLDERDIVKGKFYKFIYKNKYKKISKLIKRMKRSAPNTKPIEDLETFLANNWDAVQRAFHDKKIYGCSAEGHVSHVYSDRMSSRPMGWSETGADRMCRLRCLVQTYGEEKIIDLVKARREHAVQEQLRTGTDDIAPMKKTVRKRLTEAQKEAAFYAEKMHAQFRSTLIRKQLAIKLRLGDL